MPRTRRRLTAAAAAALVTGCTTPSDIHPGADLRAVPVRTARSAAASKRQGWVIPAKSPGPATASSSSPRPDLSFAPPVISAATRATEDPVAVAEAWALAANSSSYLDPAPGSWTERAAPFVTGAEAAAEQQQSRGGGGSTWATIRTDRCTTNLRQISAGIARDAPSGPNTRVVYLTALSALTCATGHVQLTPFTAQLTVTRANGRWFVTAVSH